MRRIHSIFICVITALVIVNVQAYKRVCYYTNWSQYRPGIGRYTPDQIDPHLCSHIIIAFAKLENNLLKPLEWNDEATYKQINALKNVNKDLKTMVAIGGWNAGSAGFSSMVSSPSSRRTFLKSSIQFLRGFDLDGLDLDWEYPTKRGGNPNDRERFTLLVKELKAGFMEEARTVGKPALFLTAAVPVGKDNIDSGYNVAEIARHLDFINLMSYDIHGSWEKVTGENAPLYARNSETGSQRNLNVAWAANYWVTKGTPRDKLIIGLPTYGRTFTLMTETDTSIGAPASGPGLAGKYTRENGFLSYYEICLMQQQGGKTYDGQGQNVPYYVKERLWICLMLQQGGKTYVDQEQKVPYYVNEKLWVGFDNEDSIRVKTEWIKENGFGGAMIWSLDLDDFGKVCPSSRVRYPLLTNINHVLNGSIGPTTTLSTSTSGSTTSGSSSTTTTSSTTSTTTTTKPKSFSCTNRKDGFYPDPETRKAFYRCAGGRAYHFVCPRGTVYNPHKHACDWPVNVIVQ